MFSFYKCTHEINRLDEMLIGGCPFSDIEDEFLQQIFPKETGKSHLEGLCCKSLNFNE